MIFVTSADLAKKWSVLRIPQLPVVVDVGLRILGSLNPIYVSFSIIFALVQLMPRQSYW